MYYFFFKKYKYKNCKYNSKYIIIKTINYILLKKLINIKKIYFIFFLYVYNTLFYVILYIFLFYFYNLNFLTFL